MREKTAKILLTIKDESLSSIMNHSPKVQERITKAFRKKLKVNKAKDLASNISDWNSDAAFLVALHTNPEGYTDAEIREGIAQIVIHLPWHIGEACKILKNPPPDDFIQVCAMPAKTER